MRMLASRIYSQLLEHSTSEFCFGQHTPCSQLEKLFGVLLYQFTEFLTLDTAEIAAVSMILFVFEFIGPGEFHFRRIYDYDMVTAVYMRGKIWFVFSAKIGCDLRNQSSECFSFCIEYDPVTLNLSAVYHLSHFHGILTFKKI